MNSGVVLWNKAKTLIPGGNQLLSKRSEMFLPDQWPSYYKRAKGVDVWDLDENHYYDMSIMGIGSCVLGYANDGVNAAVKKAVDDGSMCTFNCPEEVELAEKLVKIHPWADMVRYSRTGGEACAVAVRIGRAHSKKSKVVFCGYHGWHDWYLASNLSDSSNLDGQLLPGLDPAGVPRHLQGSSIPFTYGKIEELEKIVHDNKGDVGVIIMEVERHVKVDMTFLRAVKEIAKKIDAVLIYDEVSSGFRLNCGGIHLLHNINPDIAVLGKALGNGHPISAIIGKREVMNAAQGSFISSTYWTERVGFAAALEVLSQYEEKKVPENICNTGRYIAKELDNIFKEVNINIEVIGLASVPILTIKEKEPLVIKSLITQEMLKRKFLASNLIYISSCHTKNIVDLYLKNMKEVLGDIKKLIVENKLNGALNGPVCHSGFKRLS